MGTPPLAGPIMLTITYFYDDDSVPIDVDNIPKPILDALKGLVYLDDKQVTDVLCRKRGLNSNLHVENASEAFSESLNRGSEFLYIVMDEAPDQGVIYL